MRIISKIVPAMVAGGMAVVLVGGAPASATTLTSYVNGVVQTAPVITTSVTPVVAHVGLGVDTSAPLAVNAQGVIVAH